MSTTLRATHLRKRFGTRVVVKDVTIELNQGEVIGLLGPNGAGKTTCFYMIAGLIKADQGTITLGQQSLTDAPMDARARFGLGYLPQEPSIFRKLSVEDNIRAIFETMTDLPLREQLAKTNELIEEFKLVHVAKLPGMALSGGERRRAEIARALASEPKFLLLDEPFAGVDPISVGDIKTMIRQLADRGIGILITDHNVRETLDICRRAYIVNDGSIIAEGSTTDILNHEVVKSVYLGEDFRI